MTELDGHADQGDAQPWSNVRGRTLPVDRAQGDERLKETKTGGTRSVRLLAPLAADLGSVAACERPLVGEGARVPDARWRAVARSRLGEPAKPRL